MISPTTRASRFGFYALLMALGAMILGVSAFAQSGGKNGVILSLTGPVTPANADYLAREISAASEAGKELVIIEIDTPGGLVDSMKEIIKAMLASETPVATYVSPQGARSASAGLYIMYAAHVSAMAPSTNTGAATPVEIGGSPSGDNPFEEGPVEETPIDDPVDGTDEINDPAGVNQPTPIEGGAAAEELSPAREAAPETLGEKTRDVAPLGNDDALRAKIINDSVAYIRALAEERGRNADWAESAVREAASVTSREALELGVIDIVANDLDDLLQQMNGKTVVTAAGAKTIDTTGIQLERVAPRLIEIILGFIANPNVAVILMSLATTGIIAEIWNPGSIFPGLLGVLFLLLGLYAFSVLPYNSLGAGLMAIGAVLIFVEAFLPTAGFAGITGLLVFGAGLYLVFPEGYRISPVVILSILASVGALLGAIFVALVSSRGHGPMIGGEAIRRREGVVDEWNGDEGWVIVQGERWRARADKPLSPGDRIRVIEIDGLVLVVKQAKAGGILSGLAPTGA